MLKNFATSSRLVRDTRKFSRHSHECRAKVRDKIRKTVARNSHASEILALVFFSRQIVARFSQDGRATVLRHSHDIRTSVAKILHCKFAIISRRQVCDTRANVARPSHDRRTTVARQSCEMFWRINSYKILKHV